MPTTTYDRGKDTDDFEMLDLREASQVQIRTDRNGKVWVNLNGKCLLRVGHAYDIVMELEHEVKT